MNRAGNSAELRVLVLAPHSFYIERGTPIDVDILLRALSDRGHRVDLACYHEGADRPYRNLTIYRIKPTARLRDIGPGFSLKKLRADFRLALLAWGLTRRDRYHLIHAGEEAVFIAMLLKWLRGIPYVYDMDSSIAQQMVEKMRWMRPGALILNWFETRAIRGALACAPVCPALGDLAHRRRARHVEVLHDISQLDPDALSNGEEFRSRLGLEGPVFMYVGNFEPYQGIDLLLKAFAIAISNGTRADLVLAGGSPQDIARYQNKADELRLSGASHFIGPWPVERLGDLLAAADVLVAPRIKGVNTPMKVFPYLHSGKAVLVTDLPTHTQSLDSTICALAAPTPADFGRVIAELAQDSDLRARLGAAGRAFVATNHVYPAHQARVDRLYAYVARQLHRRRYQAASRNSAEAAR